MTQLARERPAGWLKGTALYQRLKVSWVYDAYWRTFNPSIIEERDAEVRFYRATLAGLRAGDLIYDIGANHGYKVDIFLKLGARVVAVDPDEANQAILHERFHRLRFEAKAVTIVADAVSSERGEQSFWVDAPGSAKNTLSRKWVDALRHDVDRFGSALSFGVERKVRTVTVADLVADHGPPFFVKIDVEGHELGVLQGMQQPVPYLSFEVNLPEFLEEGVACIERLHALCESSRFNLAGPKIGAGMLLGQWVDASAMVKALRDCAESSVEVFCRADAALQNLRR